ncbi:hypothetical protein CAPTEDRAFT_207275 [Capitella teleta]|uniref:Uncharacterized protein n=1 Tax=Capitella teleta TaxID=283909 RepID=R7UN50_CAPTE|nr:hypothetical protein CAPTEDRAFT_207275 [Capitella teleta]|eukprot:ELU07964.1 hypothetical protein CAPTEDRAFT_207275 [Capitella teleta]
MTADEETRRALNNTMLTSTRITKLFKSDLEEWLNPSSHQKERQALQALRSSREELKELLVKRALLETELKDRNSTLDAAADPDDLNLMDLSERVSFSISEQDRILQEIQGLHVEFEKIQKKSQLHLENQIKRLCEDATLFIEMKKEIDQTIERCREDIQLTRNFRNQTFGFCRGRNADSETAKTTIQHQCVQTVVTGLHSILIGDWRSDMWMHTDDNKWGAMTNIPFDRKEYSACESPNGIIVSGGFVGCYDENTPKSDCYEYYAAAQQWNMLPSMKTPRYNHCIIYYNNQLIVIAGRIAQSTELVSVERLQSGQWQPLPSLPYALSYALVVVVLGRLFVLSGWKSHAAHLGVLEMNSTGWQLRAPMPEECVNGGVATLDEKIYVVGGRNRQCMRYDPRADSWVILQKPLFEHPCSPALVWKDKIVVFGGNRTDAIEQYCIESDEWETWPLKMPVRANMRFALKTNNSIGGIHKDSQAEV